MRNLGTWLMGLALAGVIYLIATQGAFAQDGFEIEPDDREAETLAATGNTPSSSVGGGVAGEATPEPLNPNKAEGAVDEAAASSRSKTKGVFDGMSLSYFGILHGSSIGSPSVYQPDLVGNPDKEHPIFTQNYLNLNKDLTENVSVTGQAYWLWQPVLDQSFEIMDPNIRISHNRIVGGDNYSLYGDLRLHFGVSNRSREEDQLFALQTFQVFTYTIPNTRVTLGAFGSFKYNVLGDEGYMRQIELYAAPNMAIQMTPKLAFTMLYEMGASNWAGDPSNVFYSDGSDLEPGLRWDVNDSLTLSPYLNIMVNDKVTMDTTSFGMMVNWNML